MFKFPSVVMGEQEWFAVWGIDDEPALTVTATHGRDSVYYDEYDFLMRFGSYGAWLLVWRHVTDATCPDGLLEWGKEYERWGCGMWVS